MIHDTVSCGMYGHIYLAFGEVCSVCLYACIRIFKKLGCFFRKPNLVDFIGYWVFV